MVSFHNLLLLLTCTLFYYKEIEEKKCNKFTFNINCNQDCYLDRKKKSCLFCLSIRCKNSTVQKTVIFFNFLQLRRKLIHLCQKKSQLLSISSYTYELVSLCIYMTEIRIYTYIHYLQVFSLLRNVIKVLLGFSYLVGFVLLEAILNHSSTSFGSLLGDSDYYNIIYNSC